ncbi:MAG: hypothetical protein OHK0013_19000 [Sandaracinaceae bacterium]
MNRTTRSFAIRHRFALAAAALAAALSLAPSSASAQSEARTRARVERALLALEQTASASFWEGLGADGLAALVAIVDDPRAPVAMRRRAVTVARHYRSPAARLFLRAVAAAPHEDDLVSRYALLSLAEAFGGEVLDDLAAAFRDPRAMVREGSALALHGLRGARPAEVLAVLAAARASERERFVQVALDAAIARWSGARSSAADPTDHRHQPRFRANLVARPPNSSENASAPAPPE